MRNKRKGFSLIELIVVIAILGIAATGVLTIFFSSASWKLKQAAVNIDNGLKKTKVQTMSQETAENKISFLLECDNGKFYMTAGSEERREIASSGVSITYIDTNSVAHDLSDGNVLKITFVRSTGAFQPLEGTAVYCQKIVISMGSNIKTVNMVRLTGKTYIE